MYSKLERERDDARAAVYLREAAIRAAWSALDRNDIPAAYDALDIDEFVINARGIRDDGPRFEPA